MTSPKDEVRNDLEDQNKVERKKGTAERVQQRF